MVYVHCFMHRLQPKKRVLRLWFIFSCAFYKYFEIALSTFKPRQMNMNTGLHGLGGTKTSLLTLL